VHATFVGSLVRMFHSVLLQMTIVVTQHGDMTDFKIYLQT
jgi:hypothetical protein